MSLAEDWCKGVHTVIFGERTSTLYINILLVPQVASYCIIKSKKLSAIFQKTVKTCNEKSPTTHQVCSYRWRSSLTMTSPVGTSCSSKFLMTGFLPVAVLVSLKISFTRISVRPRKSENNWRVFTLSHLIWDKCFTYSIFLVWTHVVTFRWIK